VATSSISLRGKLRIYSKGILSIFELTILITCVSVPPCHALFELNRQTRSLTLGMKEQFDSMQYRTDEKKAVIGFYHSNPFGIEEIDVFGLWFERNIGKTSCLGIVLESLGVYEYSETVGSISLAAQFDRLTFEPAIRIGLANFEGEIVDLAIIPDISLTIDGDAIGEAFIDLSNPFCVPSILERTELLGSIVAGGRFEITRRIWFCVGLEKVAGKRSGLVTDVEMFARRSLCLHFRFRSYPWELGIGIWIKLASLNLGFARLFNLDLGSTDIVATCYEW